MKAGTKQDPVANLPQGKTRDVLADKAGVGQGHDSDLNHGRTLPNLADAAGVKQDPVSNLTQGCTLPQLGNVIYLLFPFIRIRMNGLFIVPVLSNLTERAFHRCRQIRATAIENVC